MLILRGKLIYSSTDHHNGYGAGSGDTERCENECPCGEGKVIEEHDNIPGFREHDVYLASSNVRKNICSSLGEASGIGN
jgi:hypothetical protein